MAELTNDEIQYENARLTREQWKAEAEGTPIPTEVTPVEIDHSFTPIQGA